MVKEARVSFLAQPANLERYICAVSQESSKIPGCSSWKSLQKHSQVILIEVVLSSETVWKEHVKMWV